MSVGLGLLNRVVRDGASPTALSEAGVTRDSFIGDERKVYDLVVSHFASYRVLPTLETITAETGVSFPRFPAEPLGYWIDRVEQRLRVGMLAKASKVIQEAAAEGKLSEAIDEVRTLYLGLQKRGAIDQIVTLANVASEVMTLHDNLQRSGRRSGVPFGFPYLDEVSSGAQPADTVALVGRPSQGKSYILMNMANYAYDHGETPLVATYEMAPVQCARRILALRTHVSATTIRLGRLSYWGREKVLTDIGRLGDMSGRPFHLMQGTLKSTVEDLVLRVQELRPTVVYVDGAYLLRTASKNASRWERVSETAEYLKMIASEFAIPVIATYQFNRKGAGTLGNIAYSDAIGQLASIVLGIDDEDVDGDKGKMTFAARVYKQLELLKGREGERGTLRLLYDMERMFITQDAVLSGFKIMGQEE